MTSRTGISRHYIPEIDGLRAIAVLSVLVFHFFPDALPHGFVGVDMFFVISGFLITRILRDDATGGLASLKGFYARRAKRILPAMLLVVAVTWVVATFVLLRPDFESFSMSAIATLTFTANIFFWRDGGYFGSADELKPLLHMWSLSVEEQFYILFPFFLIVLLKLSHRRSLLYVTIGLSVLTAGSFSLSLVLLMAGADNLAFFMLPTRAWQFGIGALVAVLGDSLHLRSRAWPALALLLMAVGLTWPMPVVPDGTLVSLATGLLLLARPERQSRLVAAVLTNPVARAVGLASYSIYLWHWPIAVFLRYWSVQTPHWSILLLGVALTFALSAISYFLVEVPVRRTRRTGTAVSAIVAVTGCLLLVVAAQAWWRAPDPDPSLAERFASGIQTNFRCPPFEVVHYGASRACRIGAGAPSTIAVIGNSHAQMYAPALGRALEASGMSALLIPLNGCLPTTDLNISRRCAQQAATNLSAVLADDEIRIVVIGTTWHRAELVSGGVEISDPTGLELARSLVALVDELERHGKIVFLIGPIDLPRRELASELSRALKFGRLESREALEELRSPRADFDARYDAAVNILDARLGDRLLRPADLLCDEAYCYFGDLQSVYFADGVHLSSAGALLTASVFGRVVEQASRLRNGTND